tara:strand:+ start:112 stop:420 length:309 start_codon:yes stop_codon:yes gene_type:complete
MISTSGLKKPEILKIINIERAGNIVLRNSEIISLFIPRISSIVIAVIMSNGAASKTFKEFCGSTKLIDRFDSVNMKKKRYMLERITKVLRHSKIVTEIVVFK